MSENEYEPYWSIIAKALECRGTLADDYARHPEHSASKYLVRMCEELTTAVHKHGNPDATLSEMLRLEATCTGADYHHKLALRSRELARRAAA